VVAGAAVLASQLKDGETIPTVEGKSVDVRIIAGSGVFPDTIFTTVPRSPPQTSTLQTA